MVVKNFWEICNNTDDCSDHRYVCEPDEDNVYRCVCDRFHKWMGAKFGCIQSVNASEILQTISNEYNFEERESRLLYRLNAAAGILVVVVFAIATIVVIYYGFRIERKDRELAESLLLAGKSNKHETKQFV